MGRCGNYQGCKGVIDPFNIAGFDFSAGYLIEKKFDGHWVEVIIDSKGGVKVISSTGKEKDNDQLQSLFGYLSEKLGSLKDSSLIGELDFGTERGTAFAKKYGHHRVNLFDITRLRGDDFRITRSLVDRKEILHNALQSLNLDPLWVNESKYTVCTKASAVQKMFDKAMEREEEGLVAKHPDSLYVGGGTKSAQWHKIKKIVDMDYVIMGYVPTKSDAYRAKGWIGSLRLGLYENGKLVSKCDCAGLTDALRDEISRNKDKFLGRVVEVQSNDLTKTGSMRHPRFKRFRDKDDKGAEDCVWPIA